MNEANPLIPLIDEHKIILKVVETLKVYGKNLAPKTELIEEVVDFFKTFADKLHHGKEENIFFQKLGKKPLKDEEKKILLELYEEHKKARALVARLEDVKTKEPKNIEGILNEIVALYEKHIEKENRKFFPFVFSYFTKEEKKQMCDEFILIDRKVLNEKYFQIASNIEKKLKNKI